MEAVNLSKRNKHFILNQQKLDRAKKLLGAATETETVERALDQVISEEEANRKAWAAHDKFMKALVGGQVKIVDVYGNLEG
jgi:hypothetical protein